jgi:hypothetical protein
MPRAAKQNSRSNIRRTKQRKYAEGCEAELEKLFPQEITSSIAGERCNVKWYV